MPRNVFDQEESDPIPEDMGAALANDGATPEQINTIKAFLRSNPLIEVSNMMSDTGAGGTRFALHFTPLIIE